MGDLDILREPVLRQEEQEMHKDVVATLLAVEAEVHLDDEMTTHPDDGQMITPHHADLVVEALLVEELLLEDIVRHHVEDIVHQEVERHHQEDIHRHHHTEEDHLQEVTAAHHAPEPIHPHLVVDIVVHHALELTHLHLVEVMEVLLGHHMVAVGVVHHLRRIGDKMGERDMLMWDIV